MFSNENLHQARGKDRRQLFMIQRQSMQTKKKSSLFSFTNLSQSQSSLQHPSTPKKNENSCEKENVTQPRWANAQGDFARAGGQGTATQMFPRRRIVLKKYNFDNQRQSHQGSIDKVAKNPVQKLSSSYFAYTGCFAKKRKSLQSQDSGGRDLLANTDTPQTQSEMTSQSQTALDDYTAMSVSVQVSPRKKLTSQ